MFSPYPEHACLPVHSARDTPGACITHKVILDADEFEKLTCAERLLWAMRNDILWKEVAPRRYLAGLNLRRVLEVKSARFLEHRAKANIVRFPVPGGKAVAIVFEDASLLIGQHDLPAGVGRFLPFGLNFDRELTHDAKVQAARREGAAWLATIPQMRGFRPSAMRAGATGAGPDAPSPDACCPESEADTFLPWWRPIVTCTPTDLRFLERLALGMVILMGQCPGSDIERSVSLTIWGRQVTRNGPVGNVHILGRLYAEDTMHRSFIDTLLVQLEAVFAHPDFPVPPERLLRFEEPDRKVLTEFSLAAVPSAIRTAYSGHQQLLAVELAQTWLARGRAAHGTG